MENHTTLADARPGALLEVVSLEARGPARRRLLDLGLTPGTLVSVGLAAATGDPVAYAFRGVVMALRASDSRQVLVRAGSRKGPGKPAGQPGITEDSPKQPGNQRGSQWKPGRQAGAPLVALAGNPNTGKSTIFNALTGLRQHTGNWPGKTVARAEGVLSHGGARLRLVDLPGALSLVAAGADEELARDFLLLGQPEVTVVVADATALERNLGLFYQLAELTGRLVLCLNLMDEAERRGIVTDTDRLEQDLGVPVVPTAARQGRGLDRLADLVLAVARGERVPRPVKAAYPPEVERALDRLTPLVRAAVPHLTAHRWLALRLLDGDQRVARLLDRDDGQDLSDTMARQLSLEPPRAAGAAIRS